MDRRQAVRERQNCNFLTPPRHLIVGIESGFDVIEGGSEILGAVELFGKNLHSARLRRLSSIVKYRSVSRKRTIHIGLSGAYPVDQRAQPRRVPFSAEHLNHRSTAVFMTQRAQGVDQDVNWRTFRKTAVQNADTLFGRKTLCDERREN